MAAQYINKVLDADNLSHTQYPYSPEPTFYSRTTSRTAYAGSHVVAGARNLLVSRTRELVMHPE